MRNNEGLNRTMNIGGERVIDLREVREEEYAGHGESEGERN